MQWNFCPQCGHRIFQHGVKGCETGECDKVVDCPGEPKCDSTGKHTHKVWQDCECEVKHDQLVMT